MHKYGDPQKRRRIRSGRKHKTRLNTNRSPGGRLLACGSIALLAVPLGVLAEGESASPELVEVFNSAIIERDAGNLYAAIEALHGVLAQAPQSHRAKIELAVAYYRALVFEEAERLAREVLKVPNTPEAVRKNVENFLSLIEKRRAQARKQKHRFVYEVALGGGEDDNVNQGPGSDIVDGFNQPLTGVSNREDIFATIAARMNHTYTFPGTLQVGDRAGQLLWQSQASVYRKTYKDEKDFNIDVISLSTGPALFVTRDWRAKLNLQVDYIRQSDDPLAVFSSLNPSFTWITGHGEYTVDGIVQHREYVNSANEGREGIRLGGQLSYARLFYDSSVAFSTGIKYYDQHAEQERQEHDALEGFLGLRWKMSEDSSVQGRYSYRVSDYEGVEPSSGKGRRSREHKVDLGGQISFPRLGIGWLDNWVLGSFVTYTDNQSNAEIFEYDRTEVRFTASRKFK